VIVVGALFIRRKYTSTPRPEVTVRRQNVDQGAWIEKFDDLTRSKYWENAATGEFTWSNPHTRTRDETDQVTTDAVITHVEEVTPKDDDRWQEAYDATGNKAYMVNKATGEFTMVNPALAANERKGTETQAKKRLWTQEFDTESGEPIWVNVESGEVSLVAPHKDQLIAQKKAASKRKHSSGVALRDKAKLDAQRAKEANNQSLAPTEFDEETSQ